MLCSAPRSISIQPPGGPVEVHAVPTEPSTAWAAGPSGVADEAVTLLPSAMFVGAQGSGRVVGARPRSSSPAPACAFQTAGSPVRSPVVSHVQSSQPSNPAAHESACQVWSISAATGSVPYAAVGAPNSAISTGLAVPA